MQFKSLPITGLKAGPDHGLEPGQFEAYVAVFGNVDSHGDVIVKGAFAEDLARWAASGDPIPMYWSHRMDDPNMNIGEVLTASEDDRGLKIKGALDLDADNGRTVYRLMQKRRVTQFSFAYEVLAGGWAKSDDLGEFYELRKLKLFEVGPTPVGANQETELLDVKALERLERNLRDAKAGRVLSGKNETALNAGLEKIADGVADVRSVLASASPAEDDGKSTTPHDSTATANGTGKAEDPTPSGKAEDPGRGASVDLSALTHLELELLTAAGSTS